MFHTLSLLMPLHAYTSILAPMYDAQRAVTHCCTVINDQLRNNSILERLKWVQPTKKTMETNTETSAAVLTRALDDGNIVSSVPQESIMKALFRDLVRSKAFAKISSAGSGLSYISSRHCRLSLSHVQCRCLFAVQQRRTRMYENLNYGEVRFFSIRID
jgi:hypothetical protein